MENVKSSDASLNSTDNSGIILGTSSDAIIEGLHQGNFVDLDATNAVSVDDDKDQIVNQQDQNEIVNPVEKDYETEETVSAEKAPVEPSTATVSLDKEDTEILEDDVVADDEVPRLPNT